MANPQQWTNWIYADAARYGVDPHAAWSITTHEGLSGRAGDNNTSFGPFQLHVGGALPSGRGRKWAESRAGVDYALRSMANAGAKGLRGRAAITAIASRFEKPSDIPGEISDAWLHYQRNPGMAGRQAGLAALAKNVQKGNPPREQSNYDPQRMAAISGLLSSINPDVAPIFSALAAAEVNRPAATATPIPKQRTKATNAYSGRVGEVLFGPNADRASVHTREPIKVFAARLAGRAGQTIHVGTGTNHSRITADGNVSDHWSGNAVDIPASGAALIKLGRQALMTAGMPRAKALKQRGGLYNVNGHQIIFNTHQGGDHTNHLHISAH